MRIFCREKPRSRSSHRMATSARSSIEYLRLWPSRAGTTMPCSSHHCSWRALILVSATTSLDVNVCCICCIAAKTYPTGNVSNIIVQLRALSSRIIDQRGTSCDEDWKNLQRTVASGRLSVVRSRCQRMVFGSRSRPSDAFSTGSPGNLSDMHGETSRVPVTLVLPGATHEADDRM